jgi:hypothetical protein
MGTSFRAAPWQVGVSVQYRTANCGVLLVAVHRFEKFRETFVGQDRWPCISSILLVNWQFHATVKRFACLSAGSWAPDKQIVIAVLCNSKYTLSCGLGHPVHP